MGSRSQHSRHRRDRSEFTVKRALLIVAALIAVYGIALLGIRLLGDRLEPPAFEETRGDLENRFEPTETIVVDGVEKRYWENNYTNVLLMGVDTRDIVSSDGGVLRGSGGQADFMVLLVIDRKNRTVTPIHFDRDTMTEVRTYGIFGDPIGTMVTQLTLAYSMGTDAKKSSENAVWSVSNFLGGVPIDEYVVLDLDGIAELNDMLGGVTVTLVDDLTAYDPAMTKGATLTLHGIQAEYYVRYRMDVGDSTNVSRMDRQRSYMSAAFDRLMELIKEDSGFINTLLNGMDAHLYSNAEHGRLANLAYLCSQYEWDDYQTVDGEHILGDDGYIEFWVNKDSLKALRINTFFE